ncbi:MAG: phage tail sheath subtilisin-like domain-containing protein, partial [Gemmatimonadaceae bacterium]
MSELITETILPGTYIEVRTEGLLSIGAISVGNVGLIGTAQRGDDSLARLTAYEEARARFGEAPDWNPADRDDNLSLTRAAKLLFDNGAQTVYAMRVYDPASAVSATYSLGASSGNGALNLRARTPGTWGNRLQIRVEPVDETTRVEDEVVPRANGAFTLSAQKLLQAETGADAPSIGSVTVWENGLPRRYQLRTDAPSGQVVRVDPANRVLSFATAPAANAEVIASYPVPADSMRKVTLRYGALQEVYVVPSLSYLGQLLADVEAPSKLVEVVQQPQADGLPALSEGGRFTVFAGGANGTVSLARFTEALDRLVEQDVQILVVAGLPFSRIKSAVLAHLEKTENAGRERIAFVGADSSDIDKVLENANDVADKRLVLVAPGLRQTDPETDRTIVLPPSYAAAAVAGRTASLPPHVSLTNKTLFGIDALDTTYSQGELKALVQNRVLALHTKRGVRVVKGISTHDEAFQQITTRRIVDYGKQGTRMGANQYIGKLNNRRVRENLRTTLDRFLADLVLREFLTGYTLNITADRAMEIRGEVLVTMDLMPTFS